MMNAFGGACFSRAAGEPVFASVLPPASLGMPANRLSGNGVTDELVRFCASQNRRVVDCVPEATRGVQAGVGRAPLA